MNVPLRKLGRWLTVVPAAFVLLFPAVLIAGNKVMGEIQFEGKTKIERTSGVWVDGEYVGYLDELKGSKKVLLLPGEHVITVRQNGYQDFTQRVLLQPGEKRVVFVAMFRAPTGPMPAIMATVKISVNPSRAAVFLDGQFIGHVGEFEGVGRGLLVAPGEHKLRIALPGYQTFETSVNPLANQKVEVKTDLVKSKAGVEDPLLRP
jgi:PEGA domain